jgi:glycosyltransferase 2 family protein
MTKRNGFLWLAVVVGLAVLVFLFRSKIHFDWATFWQQLRYVSVGHIVAGIALIYATYWIRAVRWAVFLSPTKKVSAASLLGSQFIGFTAVALFGRLADLTRPYLVARRVGLSLSSQVAVYTIERMFDLGAAAVIFSSALAFTPKALPHHEVFVRAGVLSMGATLAIAVFAGAVRGAGGAVAGFARSTVGLLSKSAGESIATKIIGFRDGLNARLRRGGATVAGDVGDDRVRLSSNSAGICKYPRVEWSDIFASNASDGGEHRRVVAAASDHWMVYADRRDCGCDAYILWSTD